MKTFKFWVRATLVVATITSIVGVIALIVFQFMYGWHTDPLSPLEALIRTGVRYGFAGTGYCIVFATIKLLLMVYKEEFVSNGTVELSKVIFILVKRVIKLLDSKGYKLGDKAYEAIIYYASIALKAKNIPIPKKDDDLWKLIEPKVKQYDKPATPDESFDNKRGGNPNSIFEPVKDQLADDLAEEPWVGGIETTAYKSVKDRLTEVAKTPTSDAKDTIPMSPQDLPIFSVPGVEYPGPKVVTGHIGDDNVKGFPHPKFSIRHRLGIILKERGYMGEYDLADLYEYALARLMASSLDSCNNAEIWDVIRLSVIAGDFDVKKTMSERYDAILSAIDKDGYVPTPVDLVRIEHMLKTEGGYTYTKYGLDLSALWLYLDEKSNHHIDGIGDSDLFKLALPALEQGYFKIKKQ